jgi:hypothetical protein
VKSIRFIFSIFNFQFLSQNCEREIVEELFAIGGRGGHIPPNGYNVAYRVLGEALVSVDDKRGL